MEGPIEGALLSYQNAINAWTEELLRPYLNWLDSRLGVKKTTKEFNDPVWGTISLRAHEVILLDSPLIQRLRRIRQLGVVHLVYPGANHTRFEHSLGVSHQVTQIARAMNEHHEQENTTVLSDAWVGVLRVAGLMHDIGHGVMSHVIENALADNDDCNDLLLAFAKVISRPKSPQLSEMAAFFMIRSPAVGELLAKAYASAGLALPEKLAWQVSRIIVGKSIDNGLPILHELISGPFDADKLDYMPRDAVMCGVPVVTDVVRLIQKVRAVTVSSDDVPDEMKRYVTPNASGHFVFGVARSGASALDEVSLSRSLMFDKIYRHHKVRSVEAMVGAVIRIIHPLFDPNPALVPLKLMDDQFVELDGDDLQRLNESLGSIVAADDLAIAIDLLARIRDRHLFSRAFAFAQTMPFDAYRDDKEQESGNERFVRELSEDVTKRDAFTSSIVDEAFKIADIVGRKDQLDRLGLGQLHRYIRIDPPATGGHGSESDQSRAYLVDERQHLLKVEKVRAEGRGWADAYVSAKDVGFVFAPGEIADIIHVAAEVTTRAQYKVRVPKQMHDYAKKGGADLDALKATLAANGYYEDKHQDLAPEDSHFDLLATRADIRDALERLQGYMGPTSRADADSNVGATVNETKIVHWAGQFSSKHVPLAVKVVHSVRMLSRSDANKTLHEFVRLHPAFASATLVPLGEPKDGSSIQTYFAGDAAAELGWRVSLLHEALLDDRPIVFMDDIVGLGKSASNIFSVLMGAELSEDDLGEVREVELSEEDKNKLKNRKVAVVWVAGFDDGKTKVQDTFATLGVDADVYALIDANTLPTVHTAIAGFGASLQTSFIREIERIASELQQDVADEKRQSRLLGYGNLGLLVISSYNTPTLTLGVLSLSGTVARRPWQPLFPRRKKL